jgi:hypothetical protein
MHGAAVKSIRVYSGGKEVAIPTGVLFFEGYLNWEGRLLSDKQAAEQIKASLESAFLRDLFKVINGSFRFAFLQGSTLCFTTDHVGGYPLFYRISGESLELYDNPMLYSRRNSLDDLAFCSLLASGYTIGDTTVFQQVRECEPGTMYEFNLITGKLDSWRWFRYVCADSLDFDAEELDSIVAKLFPRTVKGEYTVSLSGGIDSRFLAGCLLKRQMPFKAYSFGTVYNRDRQIAAGLAEQLGFRHFTHDFSSGAGKSGFTSDDISYLVRNCAQGRSLPNETDLMSSRLLDPVSDIITKGFCGDVLAGSLLNDRVFRVNSYQAMADYLFNTHFRLTPFSGKQYREFLRSGHEQYLSVLYKGNHPGYISAIEEWHLLQRQRKYIVNTLTYYTSAGFMTYLPFYDRKLMQFFAALRFSDKKNQKAYFTYLKERLFTGSLAPLQTFETSRLNFQSGSTGTGLGKVRGQLREFSKRLDSGNRLKRYAKPSLTYYADSLILLTGKADNLPYLKAKIGSSHPGVYLLADFLKENGCPVAAGHLTWLAGQTPVQMHINGLTLAKIFFSREFTDILTK